MFRMTMRAGREARNADFISIARRAIHHPLNPVNLLNLLNLHAAGVSNGHHNPQAVHILQRMCKSVEVGP